VSSLNLLANGETLQEVQKMVQKDLSLQDKRKNPKITLISTMIEEKV
jgi:hypothetical protein